jgi:hypothetical protein
MDHDLRAEGRRIYLIEFRTAAGELAIFALLAPGGTPEPIIARLHREAVRILALPDVRKRFRRARHGADGHLARAVRRRYRVGGPALGQANQGRGRQAGGLRRKVGSARPARPRFLPCSGRDSA